jgi:DNA-binding transcriptional MerR regulator
VSTSSHPARWRAAHDAEPFAIGALVEFVDRLLQPTAAPGERPTTERTLRYYVSQGIVRPPSGRGGSTMWGVAQLVDVLAARLAQREGMTLEAIAARHAAESTGVRERRVRAALGHAATTAPEVAGPEGSSWSRWVVREGVELHLAASDPLHGDPARAAALVAQLRRWLDSAR